jgi:hypothetical protein
LRAYTELLQTLLKVPAIMARFKSDGHLQHVLNAHLALRSLVSQRTKLTDDAEAVLRDVLGQLTSGLRAMDAGLSFVLVLFLLLNDCTNI